MTKFENDTLDVKTILNGKTTTSSYSAITGSNGSVGQLIFSNGIISVTATSNNGLVHSYFASIFAQII